MKGYLVVCDETDYNGDVSYISVEASKELAEGVIDNFKESRDNWYDSMEEVRESVIRYEPNLYIEEVEINLT